MKNSVSVGFRSFLFFVSMVALACGGGLSHAQTWSGLGTAGNNWSSDENWVGGIAPVSGSSLVLFDDPSAQPASNQDIGSLSIGDLQFDTSSGDFSVSGLFTTIENQLLVSGGGTVNANLSLGLGPGDFTVEIQDNSVLRLTDSFDNVDSSTANRRAINGDGQFLLGNGAIIFAGVDVATGVTTTFDNCSSANILVVENSEFNGQAIFRDANVDFFDNGSTFNSTVNFESGNVNLQGFTVAIEGLTTVESAAIVSVQGDVTGAGDLLIQGQLEIFSGSSISKNILIEDGGRLFGQGTVEGELQIFGLLDPGTSAGTFEVDGDVDLFETTVTCIELGGLMDGDSDLISSIGNDNTISLDGRLDVSFLDGFVPDTSDEFSFIRGFDIVGQFSNTVDDGNLSLARFDGSVFGTLVTSDGTFEIEYGSDFVRLFGFVAAVPEPGSGALAAIALFGLVLRRQKRN